MLFRWEGCVFCLFLFSSHLLITSASPLPRRDRAQRHTFAHGCQPGVICYSRKKRFSSESWEMQPCGRGRGLVDAGRTQLPRETTQSFQPMEPVLAPVTSVSVSAHSREESATSKLTNAVAEKTDGALTFEQHKQIVFEKDSWGGHMMVLMGGNLWTWVRDHMYPKINLFNHQIQQRARNKYINDLFSVSLLLVWLKWKRKEYVPTLFHTRADFSPGKRLFLCQAGQNRHFHFLWLQTLQKNSFLLAQTHTNITLWVKFPQSKYIWTVWCWQ